MQAIICASKHRRHNVLGQYRQTQCIQCTNHDNKGDSINHSNHTSNHTNNNINNNDASDICAGPFHCII